MAEAKDTDDLIAHIEEWKLQCLDTTKRNRLINCKFQRGGALRLVCPDVSTLWNSFAIEESASNFCWPSTLIDLEETDLEPETLDDGQVGGRTQLTTGQLRECISALDGEASILTSLTDTALDRKLKRLKVAADTSNQELGVNSLFLALGFLHWYESVDSDVKYTAPLILVPVDLMHESADSEWELSARGEETLPNHSLNALLERDFTLRLPIWNDDELPDSPDFINSYLDQVRELIANHERWEVEQGAAVGIFAFQKMKMFEDLKRNAEVIAGHPNCRGLAGKGSFRNRNNALPEPGGLDEHVPPRRSHLVLDSDASQHAAVERIKSGANLIIDGPPGTGKSQTIANVIAECLAAGKSVLFVSEKIAALEVVKSRLDTTGLGDLCLECHSHKADKKKVVSDLRSALHRLPSPSGLSDAQLEELSMLRDSLNAYVRTIHQPRSPLGLTPFQVQGRLALLEHRPPTRQRIAHPETESRSSLERTLRLIESYVETLTPISSDRAHPWRGCILRTVPLSFSDDVRHHFRELHRLISVIRLEASSMIAAGLLPASASLTELRQSLETVTQLRSFPTIPDGWNTTALLDTAHGYLKLQQLAAEYRLLLSAVPYLQPVSLASFTAETTQQLASVLGRARDWPILSTTIRTAGSQLRDTKAKLEQLGEALASVQTQISQIATSLGLADGRLSTLSHLQLLCVAVAKLCGCGATRPSWFDSTARRRLMAALTECRSASEVASRLRHNLGAKLLDAAFSPTTRPTIDSVLRHRLWFRRFGSSWREAKASFLVLYRLSAQPKTRQVLDDAALLHKYHRQCASISAQLEAFADSVDWSGDPGFNWAEIIEKLTIIESETEAMAAFPELSVVLPQLPATTRRHLQTAAAELSNQIESCEQALESLGQLTVPQVLSRSLTTASDTQELQASIKDGVRDIQGMLSVIQPVLECLKSDQDATLHQIIEGSQIAQETTSTRQSAEVTAHAVGCKLRDAATGVLGDWDNEVTVAAWIVKFFEEYSNSPPPAHLALLASAELRDEVLRAADRTASILEGTFDEHWLFLLSIFEDNCQVSDGLILASTPLQQLADWLEARVVDSERAIEWVRYSSADRQMSEAGLDVLRQELLFERIPRNDGPKAYERSFYKAWLDHFRAADDALRVFNGALHEQHRDRFRRLDKALISTGVSRVKTAVESHRPLPRLDDLNDAPESSEIGILLAESNKRRKHLPLRRLFARIPGLLLKLKPCLMMSPLSVSTYLDSPDIRFDVIVFDEASQVRPHDAICAVYRGAQLVVAGDQKQLPPSSFFERASEEVATDEDDDEAEDSSTGDFESILDVCASREMPRSRLKWHYRSKRESLIAFSNRHFYNDELITFPSVMDVDGSSGVTLRFVPGGRWRGGSGHGINVLEAQAIADAVMEHASRRPDKSLGVITMNQAQQLLLIDEIDKRRRNHPETEEFFDSERAEPFFVKNLENVQGDERDRVFIGIGYAKNADGVLSHNFGPLNREGGERRLNVAVTRAKEDLVVFSSIRAMDIDPDRSSKLGPKLLRSYLDFAERGPAAVGWTPEATGNDFDSDFERSVSNALTSSGMTVRQQIGCSGYKIDLALVDPAKPGRYVLGIECDGAAYHSSATARDRDRLRQEVLERKGWRIVRIWSTDWVQNPSRQLQKILTAYKEELANSKDIAPDDSAAPVASEPGTSQAPTPSPSGPSTTSARSVRLLPKFASIDEVPAAVIHNAIEHYLESFGATKLDDLLQAMARALGFERTGHRIKERFEIEVKNLMENGRVIAISDGRLKLE